jgi:hypothetical protein
MKVFLYLLVCNLCGSLSLHWDVFSTHRRSLTRLYASDDETPPPQLSKNFELNKDGTYSDRTDVNEVLAKLMATLAPRAPSGMDSTTGDDEITVASVEASFNKILSRVRDSSDLTTMEKSMVMTEANLLLDDVKQQGGTENIATSGLSSKQKLNVYQPRTKLYSESSAPLVLVHGPGLVGQATLAKLKSLGKAVDLKLIDGDSLAVMQDSELNFAVRDARTIIIAADSKPTAAKSGGGLFGGGGGSSSGEQDWTPLLSEKALKRLLNAVMNDRNRRGGQDNNIKVVAIGKATKQPKGLASFLGGETTDFDSEVILQCKQRQLGYSVVKFGSILGDDAPMPTGLRDRSTKDVFGTSTLSKEEEAAAAPLCQSPVTFTSSRVEQSEVTRLTVAVDALLRSADHPFNNSTISVLSQPGAAGADALPTDEQWDDQFLKLDGPELLRFPLRFASVTQVAVCLGRIVQQLREPGSGLITPIEVERFANGARIVFRPKETSYVSSKDEKTKARELDDQAAPAATAGKKQTKGYLSPEQEAKLEAQATGAPAPVKSKKPAALEGGLEVIVETSPYRRVRVKRCLMGPATVVKEESEAIILKALTKGIQTLEKDYRVMMMAGMKTASS